MPFTPLSTAELLETIFESALGIGGLWLLWSQGLSPAARTRAQAGSGGLAAWPILLSEFLLYLGLAIGGGMVLPTVAVLAMNQIGLTEIPAILKGTPLEVATVARIQDNLEVVAVLAFQSGLLVGFAVYYQMERKARLYRDWVPAEEAPPVPVTVLPWRGGVATFLISLPLLFLTQILWLSFLDALGYPLEAQPMVELMGRSGALWPRLGMIVAAVVLAPITEELMFRAGLFRYLRTRIPRWAALLLPAMIFAAVHNDLPSFAPLFVLGLIFELAYERTGRIGTTMIAHALFNLNTTVLILLGSSGG